MGTIEKEELGIRVENDPVRKERVKMETQVEYLMQEVKKLKDDNMDLRSKIAMMDRNFHNIQMFGLALKEAVEERLL